jgi:hypothetical protein
VSLLGKIKKEQILFRPLRSSLTHKIAEKIETLSQYIADVQYSMGLR